MRAQLTLARLVTAVITCALSSTSVGRDARAAVPIDPPKHQISTIVVAERGVLYFASSAPLVYAVSADDGSELWRLRPPGQVEELAIHDGVLYLAIGKQLHAIDAATQKTRWVFEAERRLARAGITFDQGLVFFEELFGHVFAVEEATGRERWRVHTDGGLLTLAVSAGLLLEGGHAGVLTAFDTKTGRVRWRRAPLPGTKLVLWDDLVLVHSTDGYFRGLEVATGRERWRVATGALIDAGKPVLLGRTVFVHGRWSGGDRGRIRAFDAATGRARWSVVAPAIDVELDVSRGRLRAIVEPQDDGARRGDTIVHTFDPATGRALGKKAHASIPDEELLDRRVLYVEPQALRVVDARSGELVWRFAARFFEASGAIAATRAPPSSCPLGLEPATAVRIRDFRSQRLDPGTAITSGLGVTTWATHEIERGNVVLFRMMELAKPRGRELPIVADVWGIAGARDNSVVIASGRQDLSGGTGASAAALQLSMISPSDDVVWSSTVAPARDLPRHPRVVLEGDAIAAAWTFESPGRGLGVRFAVLDAKRGTLLGTMVVADESRLEAGSRLVPGEYDVAWDGRRFVLAYVREGPGAALTVHVVRLSREGRLLDARRLDTVELPDEREGLVDLAATPAGLGIVYAGRFGVIGKTGDFVAGPTPLPRHPDLPAAPSAARLAWNGQGFAIAWGLSHDDSQAFLAAADVEGRISEAVPLGRGTGAQYFELVAADRGFFALHVPDELGGRRPRAVIGTWLVCRRE
ncbi:PQQ-like beta-propeller repeat protein [Myxococcota bacterium]|nr:PQQ-like beta-propeller repeat protein [Myxococcota bacterium]